MSEKEKAVEAEVDGAAHQLAVEAEVDGAATSHSDPEPGTIEWYKAQNAKLEKERDNYKKGLLNEKDKSKKTETNPNDLEEKLAQLVSDKVADIEKKFATTSVETVLDTFGFESSKREYIKTVYETRVAPGTDPVSIRRGIEDAIAIVDREIIQKENTELKVAQAARGNGFTNAAAGTHQGRQHAEAGFFSDKQSEELKKLGAKFGVELDPKEVAKNIQQN